jgi:hypothetical protein
MKNKLIFPLLLVALLLLSCRKADLGRFCSRETIEVQSVCREEKKKEIKKPTDIIWMFAGLVAKMYIVLFVDVLFEGYLMSWCMKARSTK